MITEHKIKTLEDIINATNSDNLDNFLKDLGTMLATCHLTRIICELKGVKFEADKMVKSFVWLDDGKNESTIEFEVDKQ